MTNSISEHIMSFISPSAFITIVHYKTSNLILFGPVFKLISTLKK